MIVVLLCWVFLRSLKSVVLLVGLRLLNGLFVSIIENGWMNLSVIEVFWRMFWLSWVERLLF